MRAAQLWTSCLHFCFITVPQCGAPLSQLLSRAAKSPPTWAQQFWQVCRCGCEKKLPKQSCKTHLPRMQHPLPLPPPRGVTGWWSALPLPCQAATNSHLHRFMLGCCNSHHIPLLPLACLTDLLGPSLAGIWLPFLLSAMSSVSRVASQLWCM